MIRPAPLREVLLAQTVNQTHLKNSSVIKPMQRTQNVTNAMIRKLAAKIIKPPAKHALSQPKNSLATTRP
jgi:hypothetical protein